ncbi:hypothetical protein TNIN_467981 [Trichonephila inaurata madagascariensis]|uniref:Uncharacterized protein n=1 Tax=Trichonephila inaurata madagascariensis TaxID=2747483 RepID=A0A8X7CBU5_9ARAC|nr:hypothetical protein TNIN_467981 [Trichonephila inaurata madagascariensis]
MPASFLERKKQELDGKKKRRERDRGGIKKRRSRRLLPVQDKRQPVERIANRYSSLSYAYRHRGRKEKGKKSAHDFSSFFLLREFSLSFPHLRSLLYFFVSFAILFSHLIFEHCLEFFKRGGKL